MGIVNILIVTYKSKVIVKLDEKQRLFADYMGKLECKF